MQEISIFNNSIYKTNYSFNFSELEPIFEKLISKTAEDDLEEGDTLTSYKNNIRPLVLDELKNFYEYLKPLYIDVIVNKWKYPKNNNYKIDGGWISKYGPGGFIQEHNHKSTNKKENHVIVAVICSYVFLPKNAPNISFKDPYYDSKVEVSNNGDNWLWEEIKCNSNDILIFPSGIIHKTEPNNTNGYRWVITNNIYFEKNKLF